MWILPKQLHTLASVQDTEALSLDLNESSQLCAQSLFVRSKPSPLRTWLQKWKRDSWTQHLFGRILKPSLGKAFETEWTSSLEVIPASHSVQQASEPVRTTQDTCGLGSQMELLPCDPESAFSRTSKDTSRWDSPASSAIWKSWVTRCRGAYSARLNAVRLTSANGCSSWPTAKARDWKDTTGCSLDAVNPDGTHRNRRDRLVGAIAAEMSGPAAPVNHSTHGSRPESWLTPRANEPTGDSNFVTRNADRGKHCHGSLTQQMKSWATPTARDHKSGRGNEEREYSELTPMVERTQSGKLNSRWCETLMGVPVGWTMPSCMQPIANPASVATMSSAGNPEDTTQTVHVLGPIAVTTDNRTDELRLLGNGVVPATSALAFTTLLNEQRNPCHLT